MQKAPPKYNRRRRGPRDTAPPPEMLERPEVIDLLRRIQSHNDPAAKNEMLALYLEGGCRWARRILQKIVYTDLIVPTNAEIASLVYQAFEKSIYTIKYRDERCMSFRNYFYLMIRFQVYLELKTTLNYRMVANYRKLMQGLIREMKGCEDSLAGMLRQTMVSHIIWEMIEYLEGKNTAYAQVFMLKAQGHKNREICDVMGLSEMSLKSKMQYIKKLLHGRFEYPFGDS